MDKSINIMGGELYLHISLKDKNKEEEAMNQITETIKDLVDKLNFYDERSLLSQLNKNRQIHDDEDLRFLIRKSIQLQERSEGLFNIFNGKNIHERKNNLEESKEVVSKNPIILGNSIELTDSKALVDLGAIAKGYIIDKALEKALNNYDVEDILLDARGDIVSYGKTRKIIEIEDPFNTNSSISEINLTNGAIVTSGHNRQYFRGGSHILGNESDILTLTLVSESKKCYELDSLATYLIQLDSEKALEKVEFDEDFNEIEVFMILKNSKILFSSFYERFIN